MEKQLVEYEMSLGIDTDTFCCHRVALNDQVLARMLDTVSGGNVMFGDEFINLEISIHDPAELFKYNRRCVTMLETYLNE